MFLNYANCLLQKTFNLFLKRGLNMTESELKYNLNLCQYIYLISNLKNKCESKSNIQINYYFDTDNFELDNKDITLRIRQIEESLKLELKLPIQNDGTLRIKNEFSKSINELPFVIKPDSDDLKEVLSCSDDLFLKGTLVTERIKFSLGENIEIDIDKNYYMGVIDYELEVEFQERSIEQAKKFINSISDTYELVPSQYGKRERFFNKLKHWMCFK